MGAPRLPLAALLAALVFALLASAQTMDELRLRRQRIWAAKCGPLDDKTWEVCFDGAWIPGWKQPLHLAWDNPIDDDWTKADTRSVSWITNFQDAGGVCMMVDRTKDPYLDNTGHFWRRDEFLTAANGFEATIKMRTLSGSDINGVNFHFFDDVHEFRIAFSNTSLRFFSYISRDVAPIASVVVNTRSVATYNIYKSPDSGTVMVIVNGVNAFPGQVLRPNPSTFLNTDGAVGRIAPRLGFGVMTNQVAQTERGAYRVYSLNYRRARAGLPLRSPPPLPPAEDCSVPLAWNTLLTGDIAVARPYITTLGDLIPQPLPSKFARTLELKAQLLTSNATQGYSFEYIDKLGGVIFTLYPDHLEAKPDIRPGRAAASGAFDAMVPHVYRFVRPKEGLYWHAYVDGAAVPVVADVHASGVSPADVIVRLGPFYTPRMDELTPTTNLRSAIVMTAAKAGVEYVRWAEGAFAPNGCA